MKILRKGFTIAEMLICFTVLGVLAGMLIPSIISNKPNKNMAMVRKAYQVTERAVAELISDEGNFPSESNGSESLAYFDEEAQKNDPDSDTARNQKNTGKFFCEQFAAKLNTNNRINCRDVGTNDPAHYLRYLGVGSAAAQGRESFTTNDGIYWYIASNTILCDPNDSAANPEDSPCRLPSGVTSGVLSCPDGAVKSPFICIYYDVNGDESPNTKVAAVSQGGSYNIPSGNVIRADRGWFYVYWNGKVVVPRGQIERYLNTTDPFDNDPQQ